MRVYYDHQIFCEQSFGGISRYFFELIKGANDMELFTPILDVKFSNNVFSQQLLRITIGSPLQISKGKKIW